MNNKVILTETLESQVESDKTDFKDRFDINSKSDWCELIKDIVAMANSGGGVLLIGVNDDGHPSGFDVSSFINYDPADITNKLFSFTGKQFGGFSIESAQKENHKIAALIIEGTPIPLVFVKTGDYVDQNGKQKQAFSCGVVYFRHGAKSEPCISDDLLQFVTREVEKIRSSWLSNIRKIVEAPEGSQIVVLQGEQLGINQDKVQNFRLVEDPSAPVFQMLDPNKTHPYRGKEVAELVSQAFNEKIKLSPQNILAIRRIHNIEQNRSYFFRAHHGTPSYSLLFVDWLIGQIKSDDKFVQKAKDNYREFTLGQTKNQQTSINNDKS